MCDHHRLRTQLLLGEIDHVNFLSENIGALFMQEEYCDITLLVEGSRFPAHKVILASRSEYFRALFFGGLRESRSDCDEIELKDTSSAAFHHLLKYVYTGRMHLSDLKEESLLDVLGLAHQYGFQELENAISNYLRDILNVTNVCLIYDIASIYNLETLAETCFSFMDCHAAEILHSDSFLSLSAQALTDVLYRDSFCAPEIEIFEAVRRWSEQNPDEDASKIMRVVRLPLMNLEDLLNNVRTSNLVCADVILDAIKLKNESRNMDLKYRGFMIPEENVATLRHGAQVIRGEMKAALLDGDNQNYDLDRGFTRHPIDDTQKQGIVVKLAQASIINTIKMLLWDRDQRSYSYCIEISMDDKDWIRVVDHSSYLCRSWQYLRFSPRVMKYIRVCGTHNTVNRVFHLVSFECMYSNKVVELVEGIIVPKENVATIEASACVIEGVSRSRNALINGDTKNYDWDSGYTCHQLGSGAIVVQLAQPYIIGSMRLLLWDCDGRSYSYYVEVSTDQCNWQTVADKTTEACRSWQVITFEKRPMTFIKIVGTHNTANEVFHCVHFECPAEALAVADQPLTHGGEQRQLAANPVSSSGGTISLNQPTFSNNSMCMQPVVAMARVNPMPSNSFDVVLGGAGAAAVAGPSRSQDNLALPPPAQNPPDLLEAESDDSLEINARFGVLGMPANSGPDVGDNNPQGMRIVWVDHGDGLEMENQDLQGAVGGEPLPQDASPSRSRQRANADGLVNLWDNHSHHRDNTDNDSPPDSQK